MLIAHVLRACCCYRFQREGNVENFSEFIRHPKLGGYLLLYMSLFISAAWLQLTGYKLIPAGGNSGPYNAICSCYPAINLLVSYFCFSARDVNWRYVGPGIGLILLGVTLLAVAPPTLPTAVAASGAAQAGTGDGEAAHMGKIGGSIHSSSGQP